MATFGESTAGDWDTSQSDELWHETVTDLGHSDDARLHKGQSYSNPYKSADLLAFYPLSEASGSTIVEAPGVPTALGNGTYNGGFTLQEQNLLGVGQVGFDGVTGSFGQYPHPLSSNLTTVTVSFWAYFDSLSATTDDTPFICNSTQQVDPISFEHDSSNEWRANVNLTGGQDTYRVTSTNLMNTGEWLHFVGVYDDPDWTFYLNATSQGTNTTPGGGVDNDAQDYLIGSDNSGEPCDGKFADVQWWNVAFTAAEVQELYDLYANPTSHWTDVKSV